MPTGYLEAGPRRKIKLSRHDKKRIARQNYAESVRKGWGK